MRASRSANCSFNSRNWLRREISPLAPCRGPTTSVPSALAKIAGQGDEVHARSDRVAAGQLQGMFELLDDPGPAQQPGHQRRILRLRLRRNGRRGPRRPAGRVRSGVAREQAAGTDVCSPTCSALPVFMPHEAHAAGEARGVLARETPTIRRPAGRRRAVPRPPGRLRSAGPFPRSR